MENMMILLFVLLVVVVAYMVMVGRPMGGLFADCAELKNKYGVQ